MTAAWVVVAAVVGLAVGSFLDVVAYRVPRGLSLLRPSSFCPACQATLSWADNVPVVSWLALRGRCRRCRAPIPVRAPLVEAATGAGFAGVVLALGRSWAAPGCCALVATVVALAATAAQDADLPTAVVLVGTSAGGVALAVAAPWAGGWHHLVDAAAGSGTAGLLGLMLAAAARGGARPPSPIVAGTAEGVAAALPAGALLGWLGLPAALSGGGAAVVVVLALAAGWHRDAGRATTVAARSATTMAAGLAVAIALGVRGGLR